MKIKRYVTAESPQEGVEVKVEDVADTGVRQGVTNIWGFDSVPNLPLGPEDLAAAYEQQGIFAPMGGVTVNLITMPPFGDELPDLKEANAGLDLGTGGNMTPHKNGGAMHRTDSIDLIVVLEGTIHVAHPRDDGSEEEIVLNEGDFLAQNGAYHR